MDDAQHYLKQAVMGRCDIIPSFLHTYGRLFSAQPLPKGIRCGRPQVCFANSYRLLKRHGKRLGLAYAEGFAVSLIVRHAALHAWCVDRDGNVFDPTWNVGAAYLGVALKTEYVMGEIKRREKSGNLYYGFLDDWRNKYPLITELVDHPEVWKQDWDRV